MSGGRFVVVIMVVQILAFLIFPAIHAERVSSPRSASSLPHTAGGSVMLDVVTVRPLPVPSGRPAPFLAPPRVGFSDFRIII